MPRIVIIGAGLSGLATAFRIRRAMPDADLNVLDAGSRAGGNIGTRTENGFTYELGPNGFLDNKPGTLQLCRDLGIDSQLIAASEASRVNRFLCLDGKLVKLPGSPRGLLGTKALTWKGKLSLMREPWRKRPADVAEDETVAAFATRRFGKETAEKVIDALVTGIHGGDPTQLSAAAAFPRLVKFEAEAGSVLRGVLRASKAKKAAALAKGEPKPGPPRMWSFPQGLQVLVDALVKDLGGALKLNRRVTKLETTGGKWVVRGEGHASWLADAVVLTTPAETQANLLGNLSADIVAELRAIPYNRIAVVALGYKRFEVTHSLDGFGYIAPQNTRRDVLGVQWCSSIFPERAPAGSVLWRALCGGVHRGELLDLDDATLIAKVHAEMQAVMGVTGEPVFARVVKWPRAIPQYVVGHLARVRRIEAMATAIPGLVLGGNAFHGIAMNDVCEQAERIASALTV
ncbi:protoporphyrinogen oxidase [soil metagenome]